MNTITKLIVAIPLILGFFGPAYSDDDSGFYGAITANRLSADFKDVNDVNFDESDTAAGIRGGYMFNDYFGVELGYIDFGRYTAGGDRPGNQIDLDADAFNAAIVINFSIADNIDLYGRIGAYQIDVASSSIVAGVMLQEDQDETEAYGALGVEWDLGELNFFAELSKADTDTNDLTIDVATIGVKFEYGR